jgi:hypothetical protein
MNSIWLNPIKTDKTNCTYKAPEGMENCKDLHLERHEEGLTSTWDIPGVGNINLHTVGHELIPVSLEFIPEVKAKMDTKGIKFEDKFLVIDSRSFVGNDVLFWALDSKGYTTNINKAHRFTSEEAKHIEDNRSTDRAIPLTEVLEAARQAVDFQNLDRKYFKPGFKYFNVNATENDYESKIKYLTNKINRIGREIDQAEYAVDEYNMDEETVLEKLKIAVTKIVDEKGAK